MSRLQTGGEGRPRPIKGHLLLDERTQRRLRRIRGRRILGALAVFALVFGALALYLSPLLRVQQVEVAGTATLDPAEVSRLASLQGQSMLRLDAEGAVGRIGFLPMVASVEIERSWPQTVRIHVKEREPWGYWQVGEDRYVIDAEGVVLQAEARAPDGAPAIIDLSNPVRLFPGDRVDYDSVALARALMTRVPAEMALYIARVEYSPASGLTVTTDAGYRVVLGDSQNLEYKLAVWRKIEEELGRDAMAGHVLDLRFGDRPSFQ